VQIFKKRECLAHHDRECLGIFPSFRENRIAFVSIVHDERGEPDFVVGHWTYEYSNPADFDPFKLAHQAITYRRNAGAKSIVLMGDPFAAENLMHRLLTDLDVGPLIHSTVDLPMARRRVSDAEARVAGARAAGRLSASPDTAVGGAALAIDAAIASTETPRRWVRWIQKASPYLLVIPAAAVNAVLISDYVDVWRSVLNFAVLLSFGRLIQVSWRWAA
jgi:hypothetical protein